MKSQTVLLIVAAILQGAAAVCNPAVAVETEGSCVCNDASLWYNYKDHICVDEEDLFSIDRCGPFASNATGVCTCNEGFTLSTSSGLCEDEDTCSTADCNTEEVCYNNLGPETCKCKDTFRRNSSGDCEGLNEALNPQWNDCQQVSVDRNDSYACNCYEMFTSPDNGKTCILNDGYEDCTVNGSGMICVRKNDSGEEQRFVQQGFIKVTETTAVDRNECVEFLDTNCWHNSHCVNLEDGLGYECECDEGYTDEIFSDTKIKECVPLRCIEGKGYDCFDPCAKLTCKDNQVCVEQNTNIGTCVENVGSAIFTKQLPGNLFTANLDVVYDELPTSHLTASLEVIFGKNAAQALRSNTTMNTFQIEITAETNKTEDVKKRFQEYCIYSHTEMPGYCEMPQSVLVFSYSFTVLSKDPCDASPCPDTHTCNSVERSCKCKVDGTAEFINFYQVCNTSEALRNALEDSQRTSSDLQDQLVGAIDMQNVIAAVLGTLLGLALVLIVVLVCFKKGRFFSG